MSQSIHSIDVAKFIGSVFIFSMHCNALKDYKYANEILEIMARWGVPFFFICSAYFLFRKEFSGNNEKAIHTYIYRIISLYILWFIYNLPSILYYRLYSKDLSDIITWFVFIKNSLLSSTFIGSWYLMSSIFSAYLVYLLSKKYQDKIVFLITLVLYVLCVLSSAYNGILPSKIAELLKELSFPLNIFNGCFYFYIGKYIAENESEIICYFTKKRAFFSFLFFYLLFGAELLSVCSTIK